MGEKRGEGVSMTRVPAPEVGVSLEGRKSEPVWMASDDSGHHHRGSKHRRQKAGQTGRDENQVSRRPYPISVFPVSHY
jgi:hypothetical protein